jgi:serine/threonine-protein kinase
LSARLLHPNIVHTYEVGEIDGHYFLAMEYLEGQIYRVVQARTAQAPFPLHEDLRILAEVARGLHYAHELTDHRGVPLGVVHRDVSPQNVFITYEGQVKLIDFGIAKTRDAGHETRVGLIKGKLNYIAPEQLRGDPLDRRADIFALGVMLWEAIAGRRFAGGPKVAEVTKVHARIKGEEPNIRTVKPDVPEQLAAIIDRAIALDREQRWSDAAAFADALEAYMESAGQRPSAKTLSARMQPLFEQDRTAMRKVIDARLEAVMQGGGNDAVHELPALPVAEELNTGSGSLSGKARHDSEVSSARRAGAQPTAPGQLTQGRRKMGLALTGAAGTIALAAALGLFSTHESTKEQEAIPVPTTAAATEAASPAGATLRAEPPPPERHEPVPKAATVHLSVTVVPAEAHVAIDGAPITTPFSGSLPLSGALHRIEATAVGYRPFVRLVPLNVDQSLDIKLEQEVASSRRSSTRGRSTGDKHAAPAAVVPTEPPVHTASSAEPEKVPAIAPGSDIRSNRPRVGQGPIDTADPYSN